MKKTYMGSCHCGKVRFEADIDLSAGTGRCNCSICAKRRAWSAQVKPADFRLISGEGETTDYQFGTMSGHHRFCKTCGIAAFGDGYIEQIGGDYVSVNFACLDNIDPRDLAKIPVQYMDGRNNNWWSEPDVSKHL